MFVIVIKKHCVDTGNFLIVWLHGGSLTKVEGRVLYIDNTITIESRCVQSFLLANAITLLTLLVMIFWDNFFVTSH